MSAALAVPTSAYVAFAFFNLLNPLITIIFSFVGYRVIRDAVTVKQAAVPLR